MNTANSTAATIDPQILAAFAAMAQQQPSIPQIDPKVIEQMMEQLKEKAAAEAAEKNIKKTLANAARFQKHVQDLPTSMQHALLAQQLGLPVSYEPEPSMGESFESAFGTGAGYVAGGLAVVGTALLLNQLIVWATGSSSTPVALPSAT